MMGATAFAAALERRGLTITEAAEQLECGKGMVSRWIRGERKPDLDHAVKIEQLFAVPVNLWASDADC